LVALAPGCPVSAPAADDVFTCVEDADCAPAGRCDDGRCVGLPGDAGVVDLDAGEEADAGAVDAGDAGPCGSDAPARAWRSKLIVDPLFVTDQQSGVPILFDLARVPGGHALLSEAAADGSDLIVTAANGVTRLPLEVVSFAPGAVEGELWWRGGLADLAPTEFWLYFGGAPDAGLPADDEAFGAEEVWSDRYVAVWHLEEVSDGTTDEYDDSAPNDIDGTGGDGDVNRLPTRDSDAPFGRYAQHFEAVASQSIDTNEDNLFDLSAQVTVSGWARFDGYDAAGSGRVSVLSKRQVYRLSLTSDGRPQGTLNTDVHVEGPDVVPLDEWHHLALVFDGAAQIVYLDGVEVGRGTDVATIDNTDDSSVKIGSYGLDGAFMDGALDEVRVSDVGRSASYIATQHAMMADNAGFWGAVLPAESCD
jgi:hypothetical protein